MLARKTLPVLAIAIALFGFIWFVERKGLSTEEARDKAGRAVDVDPAKATRIEVAGGDGRPAFVLVKKGEGWNLELPKAGEADPATAAGLVMDLCRVEIEGKLPEPVDRKAYGLDPPERIVTITADGKKTVIRLGKEVPGFEAVAIEVDGSSGAFAAKRAVDRAARKGFDDLRDRDLLRRPMETVTKIDILAPGEAPWALEKRGTEWWAKFQDGSEDLADAEKVAKLSASLRSLRVQKFGGPAPDAARGWSFTVHPASGAPKKVEVEFPGTLSGPPDGEIRLGFDGESASSITRLRDDLPGDARSLAPLGQWDFTFSKIVIRRGQESRELAKDAAAGGWTSGGKPVSFGAELDGTVSTLLRGLGNRLVSAAEAKPRDFRSLDPAWQIELVTADGTRHAVDILRGDGLWGVWYKRRTMIAVFDDERFQGIRKGLEAAYGPPGASTSAPPPPPAPAKSSAPSPKV